MTVYINHVTRSSPRMAGSVSLRPKRHREPNLQADILLSLSLSLGIVDRVLRFLLSRIILQAI